MRRSKHALALALVAAPVVSVFAGAEIDVFMRAVGYALTGSDDADPKAVDRKNCVFTLGQDTYRLNNVHVDRIKIQGWQQSSPRLGVQHYVTVSLHGDETVVEHLTTPLVDDSSEFMRLYRRDHPEAFTAQRERYKERELRLNTSDQDRVTRAWQYIYDNGCSGKKSPF
ncbi:MAG TPA: hypothetical protein VEK73_18385 [Xanthobacteraceae bacterium]|nr:hypothetical protein [Xanthobacteraceae bacterium]